MKRTAWIVAALTYLTACGGPPMEVPLTPPATEEPSPDAAPTGPDSGATIQEGDAGTGGDSAVVLGPDSAPPTQGPDAGTVTTPAPDSAPPHADAAPPAVDAAPPGVDAGTGTAVLCVPPPDGTCRGAGCPDYVAQCNSLNHTDALIRATFPTPCTEGARICGGIDDAHIPVTEPMICQMGVWRLAVIEYTPGRWISRFECSQPCATGQTCAP